MFRSKIGAENQEGRRQRRQHGQAKGRRPVPSRPKHIVPAAPLDFFWIPLVLILILITIVVGRISMAWPQAKADGDEDEDELVNPERHKGGEETK